MEKIEKIIQYLLKPEEIEIVQSLAIRDTALYYSEIADVSNFRYFTVSVINELNQPVTVQIYGNWTATTINAVAIGPSFAVHSNSHEARTITPETSGWLPFIFVTLKCDLAPTSGSISVVVIGKRI